MATNTIAGERLDLTLMTSDVMELLLADEVAKAASLLDCAVPPGWPDDDIVPFLKMRYKQALDEPAAAIWLARAMILREPGRPMIGHAGFHGPPEDGQVEFGYTVYPLHRGHGYALEASRALMGWATRDHAVRSFRVSARPDNRPSLRIIDELGFVQTGTQIDEVDGLELVFELHT